ncbi:TPA: AAA family ATPase [Klebsiella variicola]|nr:AAA family ATPase [Klebsiella variicola]
MLHKISCELFNKKIITFGYGLNVILGDDDAKNSIGKSSALMAIDFAMGGNSLLKDKAGVIKALGHHKYQFEFYFSGTPFFFSRSTDSANTVQICNDNYEKIDDISIDSYTELLKSNYDMGLQKGTFRNIVSSFSRIWNKGQLDPEHPFAGDEKESEAVSINRLIDLFEYSEEISDEKSVLDDQEKKKTLFQNL